MRPGNGGVVAVVLICNDPVLLDDGHRFPVEEQRAAKLWRAAAIRTRAQRYGLLKSRAEDQDGNVTRIADGLVRKIQGRQLFERPDDRPDAGASKTSIDDMVMTGDRGLLSSGEMSRVMKILCAGRGSTVQENRTGASRLMNACTGTPEDEPC